MLQQTVLVNTMDEKQLNMMLQEGEGYKTEFKASLDKSLAKEVVAFANSSGGRIFLGIDDKNQIAGINITNQLKSQIRDIARKCDPPVLVNLESFGNILIIEVPEGSDKPYKCSDGFYIRAGPSTQKLTRDEIVKFFTYEGKVKFDEQVNVRFSLEKDFDKDKFSKFAKLAKIPLSFPIENALTTLDLCEIKENNRKYNNACVLFFSKKPELFFHTSKAVCVAYQSNEKVKILDKKIFDLGVIGNIENAVNYILGHINTEYVIKKLAREEILQYPEEAIREAVVNAVMHRDYLDKSGDILVEVFKNKIIISNPGGLVKSLNPADFGRVSRTRNPLIASVLSRTIYVEKLGTGINRMRKAMKNAHLPMPEFEYNSSFFITFYDKTYVGKNVGNVGKNVGKLSQQERISRILSKIQGHHKVTLKGLSDELGVTEKTVERDIAKLKSSGKIKFIGYKRTGHYELK